MYKNFLKQKKKRGGDVGNVYISNKLCFACKTSIHLSSSFHTQLNWIEGEEATESNMKTATFRLKRGSYKSLDGTLSFLNYINMKTL